MAKPRASQLSLEFMLTGADSLHEPGTPEPSIDLMKVLVARIREDDDPWRRWAALPRSKKQRLEDLVFQIRRDMAVLREPKTYHPDNFFELRIESYRREAMALADEIES